MDIDAIEQPDHMSDEEWEAHKERLRASTYLAEIRAPKNAMVSTGANRSPFFLARSEAAMSDLFTPAEKAAGIPEAVAEEANKGLKTVIDTLMSVQRAVDERKGGEGAAEASPALGEDIVGAISKAAETLRAMVEAEPPAAEGDGEPPAGDDDEDEEKAKAVGDLIKQVEQDRLALIKAKIDSLMADGKSADEIRAEISALLDQLWNLDTDALAGLSGKVEEMSAKMEESGEKIEAVEKSAADRKDEITVLADLIQDEINRTNPPEEGDN